MTLQLNFYAELAGLVAAVGATLLTLLVLRNPHNPAGMKSEFMAQAASLAPVAMIAGAIAWAMTSMTDAGLHIVNAALITMAVIAASGCLLWFAFGIGERLRRAEAGRSPFEAIGRDLPQTKSKTPRPLTPKGIGMWLHRKTHR
jgi:hypothetical protein